MQTSVVLTIDTRKPKLDGTCPILLRVFHKNKFAPIRTGTYVKPEDWDENKRQIKSSYKGTQFLSRLNNSLTKKKTEASDIILKLDEQKKLDNYDVFQLRDIITNKNQSLSFYTYTEDVVAELYKAKRIGTALSYENTLRAIKKFNNKKPLTFREVTSAFLERWETHHLANDNTYNGLAVYLRTVRAIYNKAIKAGLADKEHYPFAAYTIKTNKPRKRAIRYEAIQKIIALRLESEHPLFHTRNYFLLSFFLRGMPFADLAHLTCTDLIDGRVIFDRQKTGKPYNIFIAPEAQTLLDYYLTGKERNDFIFPVIKRETELDQYLDVLWALNRYNRKLKKLATLCQIQENLSSYVSRHSFANRAKIKGISITTIKDMLGHSNIRTTEAYLDDLPGDLLDDFHKQILEEPRIHYGKPLTLPGETETGSAEAQPVRDSLA